MFLTSREAVLGDLSAAFPLVRDRFGIPLADKKDLLKMWGQALEQASCVAPVVEDADRKEGERLAAFGLCLSVPEALIGYARSEAPPYPWRWMLGRWRKGQPVWRSKKEAREAELGDGACLLANCYGVDAHRYSGADLVKITETLSVGGIQLLCRHRIHYYVEEVYGPAERDRHAAFGLDLWQQHLGAELDGLAEEQHPYLMGGDFRELAKQLTRTNTAAGKMALMGPPMFGFTEPEQEVMKLALQGLTDQAIAERIGLTLVAIKKRWEGIYAKVEERSLPQDLAGAGDDEAFVKKRRRYVLQMMAEHPEEFWPSAPKKRSAR